MAEGEDPLTWRDERWRDQGDQEDLRDLTGDTGNLLEDLAGDQLRDKRDLTEGDREGDQGATRRGEEALGVAEDLPPTGRRPISINSSSSWYVCAPGVAGTFLLSD